MSDMFKDFENFFKDNIYKDKGFIGFKEVLEKVLGTFKKIVKTFKEISNGYKKFSKLFLKAEFLIVLIKAQIFITKFLDEKGSFISRLVASSFLFFIPSYVSGYLLQKEFLSHNWGYVFITYPLILTLVWGLISPFLLLYAATILNGLFNEIKEIFYDLEKWKEIYSSTLDDFFFSNNKLFGFAWSAAVAWIVYRYFSDINYWPIKLWAVFFSFYLSFISSLGLHGINTIVNMIDTIFSHDDIIRFDPNHSDNFGGLSNFSSFVVRATLLFSSGTLIIPLGFDICRKCVNSSDTYPTVFLVLIYLIMIGYCFFAPLLKIRDFVIQKKEKLIRDSFNYSIKRSRLEKIKTNPWDLKSLLEFSFSILVPIIVTLIQIKLQS